MGHLSTSERIDASKMCSVENNDQQGKVGISRNKTNESCPSNGTSISSKDSCDLNNNIDKTKNGGIENFNSNGNVRFNGKSELNVETKPSVIAHTPKTDLQAYTSQFRGPTLFGIKFVAPLKWDKILLIGLSHALFIYGAFSYSVINNGFKTTLWALFMGGAAGFGVTGGVHRLWSHKSYKAKLPLRIILMICYSMAGQNTIYDWVRDHRVHHKFSETDADPHNSNRGFFFAHVGWLMMHKHPEVLRKGRQIDMGDILSDPVVQFHQKFFIPMKVLFCFVLPTIIPVYCWNESWYWSIMTQMVLRYIFSLNFTWSVNSAAHMWGSRPYDNRINPSENIGVSLVAMGEGWHNYHHVFPWDYKAAELGNYSLNVTTFWIDLFAKIGWAYDLKQPSKELVRKTIQRCGDGSHPIFGHHMSEVPSPEEQDCFRKEVAHSEHIE